MDELSAKLSTMADLDDELKQLKTKHEMTAKQNADMLIKLQVQHVSAHHVTHDTTPQSCLVLQLKTAGVSICGHNLLLHRLC